MVLSRAASKLSTQPFSGILNFCQIYGTQNPFDWMDLISLQGKTNFFEKRVGEYQKAGVMGGAGQGQDRRNFRLDADF